MSIAKNIADGIGEEERSKMGEMGFEQLFENLYSKVVKTIDAPPPASPAIAPAVSLGDLHYTMHVSLEDIYLKKKKKITFMRDRIGEDGKVFQEKAKLSVQISPELEDCQTITFKGEADQIPGNEPGDVIVMVKEKAHEIFDREGDNLFIVKDVSLSELFQVEFALPFLDGTEVRVKSAKGDVLHTNEGIRKIPGRGMTESGDLFVRFNMLLPDKLTPAQIEQLVEIAPPINSPGESATELVMEIVSDEDIKKISESDESDSEEDSEGDSEYASDSDEDDDDDDDEDDGEDSGDEEDYSEEDEEDDSKFEVESEPENLEVIEEEPEESPEKESPKKED